MNDVRIERVIEMFDILAANEYSIMWQLIDDFEVNGHKVSIKRSSQLKQVIIDNQYVAIGGNTEYMIPDEDGKYMSMTALEHAKYLLCKQV